MNAIKRTALWALLSMVTLTVNAETDIGGKMVLNGIVYLLDNTNNKIERFDTSTEQFLDAITLPSNGDVAAFDTEDGINFYIAVNNELMRLTVGEAETVRSTLRRVASTVVDIDLNGDYLVFSYGGESTEIWSVSASDGAFIDRTPTFSEGEEAQFQGIAQLHYLTNAQSYLLRLSEGPVIYLGFDPSTGQFGPYDGEDRLADDAAVGSDDKLYFSHQHDLAVSASVVAYRYDDSVEGGDFTALSIDEKGEPDSFYTFSDTLVTDTVMDAFTSSVDYIYAAYTITNTCNLRVGGTRVSVYAPNLEQQAGLTIDFDEVLSEIVVIDTTLYGFYASENGDILSTSYVVGEPREEGVDTAFDPNTDAFSINPGLVKVLGDDGVVMNMDEGCKHYLFEYNATTQSYGRQIEVNFPIEDFDLHSEENRLYWGINTDDKYFLGTSLEVNGVWLWDSSGGTAFSVRTGSVKKILTLDENVLVQYSDADGANAVQFFDLALNSVAATVNETLVVGEWTHATWDSENQKIVFVSGDKLYSWSMPNLTDLENAEPPEASIHFGVLSDASATQPVVINNVKQSQSDLIYINGNLYDLNSEGLLIDDAATTANDLMAWANDSLYSAQSGGSDLIERWSFSLADEGGVGLESVSDQIGQNMALVTVTVSGEESPLLITADENNVLRFITDLESSAQEVENNNTPLEEEIDVEEEGGEDEQSSDASGGSCAGAVCPDSGGAAQPLFLLLFILMAHIFRYRSILIGRSVDGR